MAIKKHLVIGIDGTNSRDILDATGSNSHVYRIMRALDKIRATWFYHHGPNTLGNNVNEIRERALKEIKNLYKTYPWESLSLFGWSRGGHIACQIAKEWSPKKIRFLGLFDAVDRTYEGSNTSTITNNVEISRHVLRSGTVGSRSYFGNTALKAAAGVDFQVAYVLASHGGVGGDPDGIGFGFLDEGGFDADDYKNIKYRHGSAVKVCRGPVGVNCDVKKIRPLTNLQMDFLGSNDAYRWMFRQARVVGKLPL